jgi:hypothetical protein
MLMWRRARGPFGKAYNEEAFRYFLAIHRRRAEQSHTPVLLVLVSVGTQPATSGRIAPAIATEIFAALWSCLREVDFTGWFRADRVTGAVLAHGSDAPTPPVVLGIAQRISDALRTRLPAQIAGSLRVRVLRLRPALKG